MFLGGTQQPTFDIRALKQLWSEVFVTHVKTFATLNDKGVIERVGRVAQNRVLKRIANVFVKTPEINRKTTQETHTHKHELVG